jgi:putative serine protease PepD
MDLGHTQELAVPPPPVPESRIADEPTWAEGSDVLATPGPASSSAEVAPGASEGAAPHRAPAWSTPSDAGVDSVPPVPVAASEPAALGWAHGIPALPARPDGPSSPTTSAAPAAGAAHRPGWAAVLLIAGLATVLAGLGGGVLGGWLASNGYLNTSFGARSSSADNGPVPTAGAGASTRPEGSVANIAAKAMPSIVTIKVTATAGSGTGSGWVLDQQGHIVTNNHVVAEAANGGTITVVLANGKHSDATIVGRDASYDLAVLKVDRTDLTPLPIGDSAKVVVGDPGIAVGAPLGLESTVTTGIVSALNRPVAAGDSTDTSYINAIQTDAAINPGNSGGPLLNMAGEVIGVNSAIATAPGTGTSGGAGSIGVGFAIPSAQVTKTVEQLIRTGKAVHPVIGVYLDRRYEGEGVKILDQTAGGQAPVTAGGPAAKAGLKAGDIILALNGRPMTSPDALVVGMRSLDVGQTVTLTVRRGSDQLDVKMVLEAANN